MADDQSGEQRMKLLKALAIAGIALSVGMSSPPAAGQSQTKAPAPKTHRIVIQVSQNDPAVMNMALNNAENLAKYYNEKGEKYEIEFVAYGAGLAMVRSDTSPVKDRLMAIATNTKNIKFAGCGNTLANQSKQE